MLARDRRYRLDPHAGAPRRAQFAKRVAMTDQLYCPTDARRDRRPRRRRLNGIDFLEVLASQRTLLVHCFAAIAEARRAATCVIDGGVRVRGVEVEWAARGRRRRRRAAARRTSRHRVTELDDDDRGAGRPRATAPATSPPTRCGSSRHAGAAGRARPRASTPSARASTSPSRSTARATSTARRTRSAS